jgi:hypothetical protein
MTAKEIMFDLPNRFKAEEAASETGTFHFQLSGENGGDYTVSVANGVCTVRQCGQKWCVKLPLNPMQIYVIALV